MGQALFLGLCVSDGILSSQTPAEEGIVPMAQQRGVSLGARVLEFKPCGHEPQPVLNFLVSVS